MAISEKERIRRIETLDMIDDLKQALSDHRRWSTLYCQELLCKTDDQLNLMSPEVHHECHFGKWYEYAGDFFELHSYETYRKVGQSHEQMHYASQALYVSALEENTVPLSVYQKYSNSVDLFYKHIGDLERFLWNSVCLTDELTGLRNRQGMLIELADERAKALRSSTATIIAIGDLDYFKKVNDQYGHPVGDEVLANIAKFLADEMRIYDRLYRYGGEEFLLCFPHTKVQEAFQILERIRGKIENAPGQFYADNHLKLTMSFGFSPITEDTIEATIKCADVALLNAKSLGRNRVELYQDD